MQKIIKEVDETRGIHQVTIVDERWYLKPIKNEAGLPDYKAVPSVTWIAQSYPKGLGYFKWLANHGWDEAEAIKTAAGDKGTKIHLAIEDVLRGNEVRIDTRYPNKTTGKEDELTLEECDAILSFLAWQKEEKPVTFFSEKTLFSDRYNYAGTGDYLCKIGNDFWVIDFKSSQDIWPSHHIQLNAYKRTIENGENHIKGFGVENIRMGILQVGYRRNKNGYKFTEIPTDFEMFELAQKIWKREHGDEVPKKKDYPIVLSPASATASELFPTAPVKPITKKVNPVKKHENISRTDVQS